MTRSIFIILNMIITFRVSVVADAMLRLVLVYFISFSGDPSPLLVTQAMVMTVVFIFITILLTRLVFRQYAILLNYHHHYHLHYHNFIINNNIVN